MSISNGSNDCKHAQSSESGAGSRPDSYVVKAGDTLGAVATSLGVSVEELTRANPNINPQSLRIVIEAAMLRQAFVQRALAGMAERRMTEIMGKSQGLGKVLVQAQCSSERAGDLHHFESMGKSRSIVIALVIDENLRLVGQPSKCR